MIGRACVVRQSAYPMDMLICREVKALCEAGFQVDVICVRLPGEKAEEFVNGVHVYRIPALLGKGSVVRYATKYLSFFFLAALKLTVEHVRQPYALIQVNTMPDFLVFVTLFPRLMGARVGLFVYEPMPELWATLHRKSYITRLLEIIQKLAIDYAQVVFAVTQQQKETFVARGAPADKITVILNVSDTHFWDPFVANSASREHTQFTLICHGAIEERYGHDTMLQAIQMVKDQIPNLGFRVLGSGSYLNKFLSQVAAMGLDTCVQYLGWVSLQQMAEELQDADVGIVAQKSSLYSNLVHTGKMYDYLAFGKPVLASRLKSVQAYFDSGALYWFEPGDASGLAQGILDLYRHPEQRAALVENSQKLYSRYNWEKQKAIYLSAYQELLERSRMECIESKS